MKICTLCPRMCAVNREAKERGICGQTDEIKVARAALHFWEEPCISCIAQYFDDTFASGIAAQNAMFSTLSNLLRTKVKTPEAAKAAKDISLRRKPVYQGDLDDIEMYFMAAVKEIKKGIGSHYAEQEAMSKKVAEKMFNELTKGQDIQHPTITAEQLADAMLDSVSGMEGATPEALEQLRSGLLGILQSAAEQENAHEADE